MSNTSVNISAVPFDIFYCMKDIHVGIVCIYIVSTLCVILGVPALSWFLWISFHSECKIKPTQVFRLHLTAFDLLFCIHLSVDIMNVFILQNTTLAYIGMFVFSLCWICRLLTKVCICLEQYLAVLYPVSFFRYKGIQYRIASDGIAWLLSSAYGLFVTNAVDPFPDIIFLFSHLFGTIVISFCCVSVLRVLKHPGPGGSEIAKESSRDVGNQQKRTAFKTIFGELLTKLLSYIPLASMGIFYFYNTDRKLMDCDIVPTMMSLNIYCIMYPALLQTVQGRPPKMHQKLVEKIDRLTYINLTQGPLTLRQQ